MVDNFQVYVEHVHIRYEDDISNPGVRLTSDSRIHSRLCIVVNLTHAPLLLHCTSIRLPAVSRSSMCECSRPMNLGIPSSFQALTSLHTR